MLSELTRTYLQQHLLEQSPTSPQQASLNPPVALPKTGSNRLLNPGPAWVNLVCESNTRLLTQLMDELCFKFYDLAWTATFSSLTQ